MVFETSAEENYSAGQIIFEEGSSGDWIYVVESGAVELSKMVNGEKVVVEVLREGEIFGDMAFFTKNPRTATATALSDSVVGILDRNMLDEEYNRLSSAFQKILRSLVVRLKNTTDTLSGRGPKQRQEPRIPQALNLTFKDMDSFVRATTHNVSGNGLFIKTPKPLEKGQRLTIKLDIPSQGEPLVIESEVAWARKETDDSERRPRGMGVKFTRINKSDHEKLKELLRNTAKNGE
ncbi:MAG: TIGR02266 family protein [Desulfatibacillaceae bacterium]